MPESAEGYERRIYDALQECSASAKGLFSVMRFWAEHNSERPGFVERDGRPITRDNLCHLARLSSSGEDPDPFHELRAVLDHDDQPLLVRQEGRAFILPLIVKLDDFRNRRRRSTRKWRGSGEVSRDTQKGVTKPECDTRVTPDPPPMVSLSVPLSSLSPSPTHPGAVRVEVSADARRSAYEAFDQWASVSRGIGLKAAENEHRKIADLLDSLAQETPIVRGSELIGRHLLAAKAADLAKQNGKEFKGVAYACATVKSALAEWEAKGIPGSATPHRGRNGAAGQPIGVITKPRRSEIP